MKRIQFWKKLPRRIKHTCSREPAMNMQQMLCNSPGHLLQLAKGPIFKAIIRTSQNVCYLHVPSRLLLESERFSVVDINMGRMSTSSVYFCTCFFYHFDYTLCNC